jgi:hypothetical protein
VRAFARWRVRVWDRRLTAYRKAWNQATVKDPVGLARYDADALYERLTTQALVKRTTWRKRAGVRR